MAGFQLNTVWLASVGVTAAASWVVPYDTTVLMLDSSVPVVVTNDPAQTYPGQADTGKEFRFVSVTKGQISQCAFPAHAGEKLYFIAATANFFVAIGILPKEAPPPTTAA